MDAFETYRAWLDSPALSPEELQELRSIAGDAEEITERFYTELSFGTAGLRGVLGMGTNRMNVHVVRRATRGLADALLETPENAAKGVVIAYDSRNYSDVFACEAARVLAAAGIRAYLFPSLRAVPQLSFAVRDLGCAAGIVITASHNPKKYNGYKVYAADGGQAAPEAAAQIYAKICAVPMFSAKVSPLDDPLIETVGPDEDGRFYAACEKLLLHPERTRAHGGELALVYTPLHGSGNIPLRTLLSRIGLSNVTVVPEQAAPDGEFPTVSAPNPEDPHAFDLAIPLAEQVGATVCLATDPDADRLGAAVKTQDGSWKLLSGNQIGCLLLYAVCEAKKHALQAGAFAVRSVVSTPLADRIAKDHGVAMVEVLTGFRFISQQIELAEESGGERHFLFGFEESYGFLAGTHSRDKDAISSAMLFAELALSCKLQGLTVYGLLERIYARYGYYREITPSFTLEGREGAARIKSAMHALRTAPPAAVAGTRVTAVEDYKAGIRVENGIAAPLSLGRTDMLRFLLADGTFLIARPSGTEPKLKLYIGVHAGTEAEAGALLENYRAAFCTLLSGELNKATIEGGI